MTSTILVPLDGSTLAERAMPLGERLAKATSARLVLARVLPSDAALVELAQREVSTYLEHAAATLRERGASVETAIGSGNPAAEIVRIAHENAADLLVMSTHGRSGPGRWIYGSVADEVLRRAGAPVMLVTPDAHNDLTPERPAPILVPLDGSGLGEAALPPAREWAAKLGAELILLRVAFWPPMIYADDAELMVLDPSEELRLAEDYLNDVAARWRSDATPVRVRALVGQQIPTLIAQ